MKCVLRLNTRLAAYSIHAFRRKLFAYRALHDELDCHKEVLEKRRKLLEKMGSDAQQTGKGLMSRLVRK